MCVGKNMTIIDICSGISEFSSAEQGKDGKQVEFSYDGMQESFQSASPSESYKFNGSLMAMIFKCRSIISGHCRSLMASSTCFTKPTVSIKDFYWLDRIS